MSRLRGARPLRAVVLAVLMSAGSGVAQAADPDRPDFYNPPPDAANTTVPSRAAETAAADMNGDGRTDLIVVRAAAIEVALASGAPGAYDLTRAIVAPGCERPESLALPDLDGDGDRDAILSCRRSSAVLALDNGGEGVLAPSEDGLVGVGPRPRGIAAGDFDRDGDPDLAVAVTGADRVAVLENRAGALDRVGGLAAEAPQSIETARYDAGRDLDLAVGSRERGEVVVLSGEPRSGFERRAALPVPGRPVSLAAGDVTGDGLDDMVVAGGERGAVVRVLAGDGSAGFEVVRRIYADRVWDLALGDVDGSGVDDLAVGGYRIDVFLDLASAAPSELRVDSIGTQVAIADLDADGDADLASDRAYRALSLQRPAPPVTGDVSFEETALGVDSRGGRIVVGDFNGDGVDDAVTLSEPRLLLGGPGGPTPRELDPSLGYAANGVACDFDADGRDSLALGSRGARVIDTTSSGDPTGEGTRLYRRYVSALDCGDFDGDGNLDLAVLGDRRVRPYGITILWGDGEGGFERIPGRALTSSGFELRASDLDADGTAELIGQPESGSTPSLYTSSADRTLTERPDLLGETAYSVLDTDLDSDGRADLVARTPRGPVAFLAQPDGSFAEPSVPEAVASPIAFDPLARPLRAADFDGDGVVDLLGVTGGAGNAFLGRRFSVRLGDGDGGFSRTASGPVDPGPAGGLIDDVAVGDFDDDGDLDLLEPERYGGLSFFRNRLGDGG